MTVAQWEALPWWQQRMYVDGLEEEGVIEIDHSEIPLWTQDPLRAPADDFASLGITVLHG